MHRLLGRLEHPRRTTRRATSTTRRRVHKAEGTARRTTRRAASTTRRTASGARRAARTVELDLLGLGRTTRRTTRRAVGTTRHRAKRTTGLVASPRRKTTHRRTTRRSKTVSPLRSLERSLGIGPRRRRG